MPSGLTIEGMGHHDCHHSLEDANYVLWMSTLKCLGEVLANHFRSSLHGLRSYSLVWQAM